MWEEIRETRRVDLGENTLGILREFDRWFLPASIEDVGGEFLIFLKWLEKKGYVIIPAEDQL